MRLVNGHQTCRVQAHMLLFDLEDDTRTEIPGDRFEFPTMTAEHRPLIDAHLYVGRMFPCTFLHCHATSLANRGMEILEGAEFGLEQS